MTADQIEVEKAALTARYEALSAAADECTTAPNECDMPSVLGEFADPETQLYKMYLWQWNDEVAENQHIENLQSIERTVIGVEIYRSKAWLLSCVVDGSALVSSSGEVINDGVDRRQEELLWTKVDGQWRLTGGTVLPVKELREPKCER